MNSSFAASAFRPFRFALLGLLACGITACGSGGGGGDNDGEFGSTAFYKFDEESGSTATNSRFNAFHGTLVGVQRTEGRFGRGVDFTAQPSAHVLFDICCHGDVNGNGSLYIDFPNNQITMAMWVRPVSASTETIYPILGGNDFGVQSFKLRLRENRLELLLYPPNNGAPFSLIRSASLLSDQQWTHIALVYDGSTAVIYLNGEENSRVSLSAPVQTVHNDLFLGGIPETTPSFPGRIDELLLSTTAFTQAQVRSLLTGG
ncbi:LamG domain-containing protein [Solimonas sp. K1W22B-7]|uniref:LamG domain-containing protein n=1 Tax=Solimonas sp. K1W22B-7 TaxID=2303331 RepID=UPI000E32DB84|nr:LamG domain-containing protein [Solimonas sp. K1W22B-7]AXQ29003.1 LamG domain-containing protein [Solimonas sp. K1W22B-7]